jgi:hypothetical protein
MKKEIKSLYPSEGDVYDMIDKWRNDLMRERAGKIGSNIC